MKATSQHKALIQKAINSVYDLGTNCWNDIEPLISHKQIDKLEHFSQEGQYTKELGFILDGILRIYYLNEKGTWKAEFTEGIYTNSDIVVKGRSTYDATIDSGLLEKLYEKNIMTIYVCGFTTNHCVKETMNTLIAKGFDCIMVADCTASFTKKLQKYAEKKFNTIACETLIELIKEGT